MTFVKAALTPGLSSMEAAEAKSARGGAAGIDGLTASMVKSAASGTILGHAFEKAIGWLKEYGRPFGPFTIRFV